MFMKFVIGSMSERKINTARQTINGVYSEEFEIVGFAAKSNVPETPWDRETFDGAKNRAFACREKFPDADFCIGMESGLVERYGHVYEEAWSCILDPQENEYYGFSSGLKVPDFILTKMKNDNIEHNQAMFILEQEHNLKDADTWGSYSGDLILREVSLQESLRNALIQIFAPDKSFYKKSA